MADFRTKLITLAGIATMFTGMAYGQAVCGTASALGVFIRGEGTTEQVADVTVTCTVPTGNNPVAAGQTINITALMSPSAAITSANVGTGNSPLSEAVAGTNNGNVYTAPGAAAGQPTRPFAFGQVSNSQVTFSGITLPNIAVNGSATVVITNIKINASTIATSTGVPTIVTETLIISGTGVSPNVLQSSTVAYVQSGLAGIKATGSNNGGPNNFAICSSITAYASGAAGVAYNVQFSENFPNAFKVQGTAAGNNTLGSWAANHTETGFGLPAGTSNGTSTAPAAPATPANVTGYSTTAVSNQAASGTRIKIVFNNVPSGVNIYVPISFGGAGAAVASTATNGAVLTLTSSETGALSAVPGTTANNTPGAAGNNLPGTGIAAQVPISNGTGTAVYELTTLSSAPATFTIPVYLQAGSNALAAPASAITSTVSFAPIGVTTAPNFVSGASTATVNGSSFTACNTTLLFPFVTNQLGFDTGLAIANTSNDLLNGGTKSNAANQSGTCSLTFFGASAPAAVTTATLATGTVYAAAASTLAPGFQGYMIANCNFLYGHGFAYVVYNLTQNNGAAMGYLANVINSDRKAPGGDGGISNTNPESVGQ